MLNRGPSQSCQNYTVLSIFLKALALLWARASEKNGDVAGKKDGSVII